MLMNFRRLFGRKKPDAVPVADAPAAEPAPIEEKTARVFNADEIEQAVIVVLHTVYDPEIPIDIYELGLVYNVDVDAAGKVVVRMTLTSPGCPVAGSLVPEIEGKVQLVPGVSGAKVVLVWDPPWNPDMMSEAAKLQLGIF